MTHNTTHQPYKDYARFFAKRLDGNDKSVHLSVEYSTHSDWVAVWVPRRLVVIITKPKRAGDLWVLDIEQEFADKNIYSHL